MPEQIFDEVGPAAYRTGYAMFEGFRFKVDERVLVPREETELLVLAALGLPDNARVHEVGTGCGAVAVSIKLKRPDLRVTASDISADAIDVAKQNARRHGIMPPDLHFSVCEGIPFDLKEHWVDLIVANLPYLTDDSIQERPAEVQAEPTIATVGRCAGDEYAEIRRLIEECPPKRRVALEHDTHMGETVREMLVEPETMSDQTGAERMTTGLIPLG